MSYILRRDATGNDTCGPIAEYAGLKVVNGTTEVAPADVEYVFRWGTTKTIPNGPKIINKADAIRATSDKRGFRLKLSDAGLAPVSYGSLEDMLRKSTQWPTQKLLTRPGHHQRSESMFLSVTPSELMKSIDSVKETGPYYISEFVQKKQEYRVFVAQNRVVWMIEKHPKSADEVSWGCVEQGKFDYVGWGDWPKHVVDNALASMKLSGLDFGAVDIIVTEENKALTTEINTSPFLTPYYIKCIGKVFKYITEKGRDHFPDPVSLNWSDVIHPSIK